MGGARRPSGPGRHPRGAERDARARARADPARADDRLAVHVLPRRRGDHGVGPVAHADDRAARAVLRRCAPVELRRVRGAGPPGRLRSQRLRRDAAGAVRVGRQAPGRELRRRRARQRPPSQGAARGGARDRRGLPDDDGDGGDDALPRRLVRARSTSSELLAELAADRGQGHGQGRARRTSRRRARGRAWARSRSSPSGSTAATGSSSSRRSSCARPRTMLRRRRAARPPGTDRLRAHRWRPIGASCSTTTTTRTSRARSSASARSAPRRSWCC